MNVCAAAGLLLSEIGTVLSRPPLGLDHNNRIQFAKPDYETLQACAAAELSLSEIGTVMSRPLVGLEEEPSELERLCMRVREAVAAQEEEVAAAAARGGGAEYWDGESSSSDSGGSGDGSDSDGELTPRAAPARALRFAGPGGPSKQLPLLQADREPLAAVAASALPGLGLSKTLEPALAQPLCGAVLVKNPAPLANTLVCVDEDDSLHEGLGLLSGALKPTASAPHDVGGTTGDQLRQTSGSSGEGSAFGPISLQSGASDAAGMSLRAFSNGLETLKEAELAPDGQGGAPAADEMLFDFDDGAHNRHSAAQTPTRGISPVSPVTLLCAIMFC